ncbi:MAG: hypothetical protein WBN83_16510 [Desulfoprunum sp.]|uniref:hypothetical protein n=1 Tax=Desulfoprunum sp. TaxID=2020866 RepID=UPI00052DCCD5|nr:hypothetical protein JT06_08685 [Desulfobulbus sp. Tol-SR]
MTALPTQLPGERVKKALVAYCEMKEKYPERDHRSLLQQVETRFDLTPLECEFLNRQILEDEKYRC